MTREEAMKIWRKVAFGSPDSVVTGRMIEAFANKVAEQEREAWAKRLAKQAKDIRAGEMTATTNGAASALENAADMMRSNAELRGRPLADGPVEPKAERT